MRKKFTFLFWFLLLPFVGFSQTGQVIGGVIVIGDVGVTLLNQEGGQITAEWIFVPNAVNNIIFTPSITGNGPILGSDGTDTNIDLRLQPKGAGNVVVSNSQLDLSSNKIINVVDPTSDQDAATKKYVDDNVGGVFGSEFEIFQSLGQSNTTSTTLVSKIDITSASKPVGTYRIGFSASLSNSNGNQDWRVAFSVDGTLVHSYDDGENRYQAAPSGSNNWSSQSFVFYLVLASPATVGLDIDFAAGGSTARIADATIEIWRVL